MIPSKLSSTPGRNCSSTVIMCGSSNQEIDTFDVAKGSFHGIKVCELVSLYLLDQLEKMLGKEK